MLPTLSRRGIAAARAVAAVLCVVEAMLLARLYLPPFDVSPSPTAALACPAPSIASAPICCAFDASAVSEHVITAALPLHLAASCPACLACPSSLHTSPALTLHAWGFASSHTSTMLHESTTTNIYTEALQGLATPSPLVSAAPSSRQADAVDQCGPAQRLLHGATCADMPEDIMAHDQWLQQQHEAQAHTGCAWSLQVLLQPDEGYLAAIAAAAAQQDALAAAAIATPTTEPADEAAQPPAKVIITIAAIADTLRHLLTILKAKLPVPSTLSLAVLSQSVVTTHAVACVALVLLALLAATRLNPRTVLQLVSPMTPYQAAHAPAATPEGSGHWGSRGASQHSGEALTGEQGQHWWQQQQGAGTAAQPSPSWRGSWGSPIPALPMRLSLGSLNLSLPSLSPSPFTFASRSAVSGRDSQLPATPMTGNTAQGPSPSPLRSVLACLSPILAAQPSPGVYEQLGAQLPDDTPLGGLEEQDVMDEAVDDHRLSALPMSPLLLPFAPQQMVDLLLPQPLEQHNTDQQYNTTPHLPGAPAESSPPSSVLGSPAVISAVKAVAELLPSPITSMMTGSKAPGSRYNTRTRRASAAPTPSQSYAGGADSDGGDSDGVSRQASDLSGALKAAGGLLGSAQKAARGVLTRSARKTGAQLVPVPDDEQLGDQDHLWASSLPHPSTELHTDRVQNGANTRQRSGRRGAAAGR